MTSSQNPLGSSGDDATRLYSIGDLSSEFDISPRAIRFYEDQGLLQPQRIGGNRVYNHRDRVRLMLVLRAKRLGFSLADTKELLDLYDVDPEHLEQLRAAVAKGQQRMADLERQRTEITETLKELRELEAMALARLKEREAHGPASAARPKGEPS